MARITHISNGESGLSARTYINQALQSVDVDNATIYGDGTSGNTLRAFWSGDTSAISYPGAIGISTRADSTPTTGKTINILYSVKDTEDVAYAVYSSTVHSGTTDLDWLFGIKGEVKVTSSGGVTYENGATVAGYFYASNEGTGTVEDLIGVYARVNSDSHAALNDNVRGVLAAIYLSGTSDQVNPLNGWVQIDSASATANDVMMTQYTFYQNQGTVTNLYGINMGQNHNWGNNGGSVQNAYAIYIDASTNIGSNINYAIKSDSTADSVFNGRLILSGQTYDTSNGLWFGAGIDSGFYESYDNAIFVQVGGSSAGFFGSSGYNGSASNGFKLKDVGATSTVPNIVPRRDSTSTGIGAAAANKMSLIAESIEIIRISSGITNINTYIDLSGVTSPNASKGRLYTGIDGHLYYSSGSTNFIQIDNANVNWGAVNANIIPDTDGVYTIGTGSTAFKDLYLSADGIISISGTVRIGSGNLGVAGENAQCVFIGENAGHSSTTGDGQVFIGYNAGHNSLSSNAVAIGGGALYAGGAPSLFGSVSVGINAGFYDTGAWNTYIGGYTGQGSTYHNGNGNVAIGYKSLFSLNGTASTNVVIGREAGYTNTIGDNNVYLGAYAGYSGTTASNNVMIGYLSGRYETGSQKLYIANDADDSNNALIYGEFDTPLLRINAPLELKPISEPTAIQGRLYVNTDGHLYYSSGTTNFIQLDTISPSGGSISWSTPVDADIIPDVDNSVDLGSTSKDFKDLYLNGVIYSNGSTKILEANDNPTGDVILGFGAGASRNGNGNSNTFIGYSGGGSMLSGSSNTFLGYYTGFDNVLGNNNTFLGYQSGFSATGSGGVFIGKEAGYNETGDNRLYIANSNADQDNALIYGEFDTPLLYLNASVRVSGYTLSTNGIVPTDNDLYSIGATSYNYASVHTSTLQYNTTVIFKYDVSIRNVFVGPAGNGTLSGTDNIAIGYSPGSSLTTGDHNIVMGYDTANLLSEGNNNVIIGRLAADTLTTGDDNVIIGPYAGRRLTSDSDSVMVGRDAGTYASSRGDFFGFESGKGVDGSSSGANNVGFGYRSLTSFTTGAQNVAIGYTSSGSLTEGQGNTSVGYQSGYLNQTGSTNIFIGYQSGYNEVGDNKLYISNSNADSNNALIYGEFDNTLLRINGRLEVGISGSVYPKGIDVYLNDNTNHSYGGYFHNYGDGANYYRYGSFSKAEYSGTTNQTANYGASNRSYNYGSASIAFGIGTDSRVYRYETGTANNLYAEAATVYIYGSGTVDDAFGYFSDVEINSASSSNVTRARGYYVKITNASSSNTIDEASGVVIGAPDGLWSNNGTVNTSQGIYIDGSIDIGTTKYAINSQSSGTSLFSGDMNFGSYVDMDGISAPSASAGRMYVGTDGHLYYSSGATNFLQLDEQAGGTTITNSGDNRILTSDGTASGINAESNLTFTGSLFTVTGNQTLTGQIYYGLDALSETATIATNCNNGNIHTVTLTANRILGTPTNAQNGAVHQWIITQDGGGTNTLDLSNFTILGSTTSISTTGSAVSILTAVYNGSSWLMTIVTE